MATQEKKETPSQEPSSTELKEETKLAEDLKVKCKKCKKWINKNDEKYYKCYNCNVMVCNQHRNLVQYGSLGTRCKRCNEIEKEKRYFTELGTYYD